MKLSQIIAEANERASKVAVAGLGVTKEQVQAGWQHLSEAEKQGFTALGWAPER